MDRKKSLIISVAMLAVFAVILTIGVLTENKGKNNIAEPTPTASSIDEQKTEQDTESKETSEEAPVNNEPSEPQILTIDNCAELADILQLKNPEDVSVKTFAEKYKNQTIEFDANIVSVTNYKDYDTRYDILISSGDYNESTMYGPNFKFENVNTADMDIDDLFLPDYISVGNNIHVVAEVEGYDESSGIFELDPVSVQKR